MKSRAVDEFYGTGNYKREDSEADSCHIKGGVVLCKKDVAKTFANLTKKVCARVSFLITFLNLFFL